MKNCKYRQILQSIGLLISVIYLVACSKPKISYPPDLSQLNKNIINYYLDESFDALQVGELLESLNSDGSWSDIDYTNNIRGGWPVKRHLDKVLTMCIAYKSEGSEFYNKKQVSQKIHLALNYWLDNDFLSPNWWDQHIGVPRILGPILFLIEDELSPTELSKSLVLLRRAEIKMTGQNKVWLSGNVLYRSLLLRDVDSLAMASQSIQEELSVSFKEGIQFDWSYHQHGSQLQMGNYGLTYLEDMTRWLRILKNTPFEYSDDKTEIIRNYILEGQQWITWKDKFDISVCGRQLFKNEPAKKASRLKKVIEKMARLDEEYKEAYSKALDYRTLSGNKHFWQSDFHVHRNKDYYFSVKMNSNRVLGAESVNGENIQGYHLGDGATYLYQSGKEYENIFPFWNWRKIPGTTLIQDTAVLPRLTAWGYHIDSDFVGGVSDGEDGIAVMDYMRDGLTAHKSWFMFNEKIVCLGSDINAKTIFSVNTTVNQVFLEGEIIIASNNNTKVTRSLKAMNQVDWILHNETGYLFPDGGNLKLEAKYLEGTWHKVLERERPIILTDEMFRLWFDHGSHPKNETYQYILVPNATEKTMHELQQKQPFIIKNEKNLQSVISSDETIAGIIFYKAGKSTLFGGIEVDQPCMMMLKKLAEGLSVSISDPTHKLQEINCGFSKKYSAELRYLKNEKTWISFELPYEGDSGKTVNKVLTKK